MLVNNGVLKLALPEPSKKILWLVPPSILYKISAFGVPEKVIVAVLFSQIVISPDIVAVGNASGVTLTDSFLG